MKNLFAFLLAINTFCSNAQNVLIPPCSYICWREGIKIKWSDFQASRNPLDKNTSLYNSGGANTATEIDIRGIINSKGSKDFIVYVKLNKAKSWVRDSSISTTALLMHEQLHFDIAELVGRRIRLHIAQARDAGVDIFSQIFSGQIELMLDSLDSIHDDYDKKTEHGLIANEQKKWQDAVNAELRELDKYKSTAATCQ